MQSKNTPTSGKATAGREPAEAVADPEPVRAVVVDAPLYTRHFFEIFLAVVLFMTGLALQFHFGQYLEFRGHGVGVLGRVLAVSTIGVLLIRLQIGHWIDRVGCRSSWLLGTLVTAVAVMGIQFAENIYLITGLRTISTMASALAMTTMPVFAAQLAPPRRKAESIGTMGLAGFIGMIIGPTLGDWVFSGDNTTIVPYRVFFTLSAACSFLAALAMVLVRMPENERRRPPGDAVSRVSAPPQATLRIILRYWPGAILLVGFAFSMAFCMQLAFLERLAEARGFNDIKVFFLIYGPTAMSLRIVFRRLPERFGRRRTLLLGLLLLCAGLLCLIGIRSQWQLAPAALLMGAGHCFVFPSMVDLGASRFPPAQRGIGTTLVLGAGDLGILIGFVALGQVIDAYGFDAALLALASLVLAGALIFARVERPNLQRASRPSSF